MNVVNVEKQPKDIQEYTLIYMEHEIEAAIQSRQKIYLPEGILDWVLNREKLLLLNGYNYVMIRNIQTGSVMEVFMCPEKRMEG